VINQTFQNNPYNICISSTFTFLTTISNLIDSDSMSTTVLWFESMFSIITIDSEYLEAMNSEIIFCL